jgi:hypothetical protein
MVIVRTIQVKEMSLCNFMHYVARSRFLIIYLGGDKVSFCENEEYEDGDLDTYILFY